MRRQPDLDRTSRELTPAYLAAQDCVLIVSDHSAYDWGLVAAHAPLIVDTRNALRDVPTRPGQVVKA